ncbi:SRPBCC family protein [Microbacterium sp. RD1]|uniref:SRPBCC family protein n=1 Tax=Microbacterium sp. RD1 TaxID=3457313 RepID=UPI003FA5F2B0
MTLAFSDRRLLPASPDAVWQLLTDWPRGPQWLPGVSDMRADGPLAVGTVVHFTARGRARTSTVSAVEPGRTLTLTSRQPGVRADYRYALAPVDAGTAVELAADIETRGPMRLLGPVIRRAIAAEDGAQLERLARLL